MNTHFKLTLLATGMIFFGAASAQAASLTLPLGQIHTGDDIENYFIGGTDSTGQTGTNLGFGFSSNATAQAKGTSQATGDGRFENNPSGQSEILAYSFSNSTASYLNYAAGFSALSFNYSFSNNANPDPTLNAYIYSGVNGQGTLLDTLALTPAATGVACTGAGDAYCTWSMASTGGAGFAGTGESVLFGTSATGTTTGAPVTLAEFDGVSVTPVPLPAALWLLISGGGALFGFARRRLA